MAVHPCHCHAPLFPQHGRNGRQPPSAPRTQQQSNRPAPGAERANRGISHQSVTDEDGLLQPAGAGAVADAQSAEAVLSAGRYTSIDAGLAQR